MRENITQLTYLAASILFILGLRSLTRPDKARRGMQQAALGMLLAIAGTLVNHQILDYKWIAIGMGLGAIIGYPLGMWVPMTAMPQRIALALSFSALAATLVGVAEYYTGMHTTGISHAKAAPTCRWSSRFSTRTPGSPHARRDSRSETRCSSSPARSMAPRDSSCRS